jgi:hypothetical protein
MLRNIKHLKKLILEFCYDISTKELISTFLKILKVVAPHGRLRHLEFFMGFKEMPVPVDDQKEWTEVFSQICAKLIAFVSMVYDQNYHNCS